MLDHLLRSNGKWEEMSYEKNDIWSMSFNKKPNDDIP